MWARLILVVASAITALSVSRDAPNFDVVSGMVGIGVIAAIVLGLVLLGRRRGG
jgi:hypothetical protein